MADRGHVGWFGAGSLVWSSSVCQAIDYLCRVHGAACTASARRGTLYAPPDLPLIFSRTPSLHGASDEGCRARCAPALFVSKSVLPIVTIMVLEFSTSCSSAWLGKRGCMSWRWRCASAAQRGHVQWSQLPLHDAEAPSASSPAQSWRGQRPNSPSEVPSTAALTIAARM